MNAIEFEGNWAPLFTLFGRDIRLHLRAQG
jgi:hypothetical protein